MSKSLHSDATRRSFASPMLFGALDSGLQAHLRKSATQRYFADEQIIQQRGSRADGFWLIEEGSVIVGQFMPDGDFRALALLGPGDSYGELAVFSDSPRVVDAISRGQSRLLFVSSRRFLDALGNYPASMRALLGALSLQLQDTLSLLAGMRRGTNPARMAELLVNLAGDEAGAAELEITQQELAELLGVTRVTANSALSELQRRGLISRGYGVVSVIDRDRLMQFALA